MMLRPLLLSLLFLTPALALDLPSIFSDGMVLQRDQPIAVWGKADDGETVRISLNGKEQEAVVADGKWFAEMEPMPAGGPYEMSVSSGKKELELKDVWLGEVWVLGGQSNMRWPLGRTQLAEAGQAIAQADSHPRIRLFDQAYTAADAPSDDVKDGKWSVASCHTAPEFPSIGYYFALRLEAELDVAVGLVQTAVGGTNTRSWMSPEFMKNDPKLHHVLKHYAARIPRERAAYAEMKAKFQAKVEAAKAAGKPTPNKPGPLKRGPADDTSDHRPGGYYRARVTPLQPLAVRGVIWYQGESNASVKLPPFNRDDYGHFLSSIIANWRQDWKRPDMPFLIVQLPAYGEEGFVFPEIREAQEHAVRTSGNAALIVGIDTGEEDNVHPGDKFPIANRLAETALAHLKTGKVKTLSPLFKSVTRDGSSLLVEFKQTGSGLVKTRFSTPQFIAVTRGEDPATMDLNGFEVAGADGKYLPSRAAITGDRVKLWTDKVPAPVAARYLWTPFPSIQPGLYTSDGFPVAPFRFELTPEGNPAKYEQ